MSGTADAIGRWPRVPVGLGFEQWRTSRFERTVLVVARTLTSTVWGLDFLGEVLADPRIQTVFTVEDESPSVFWQGAHDLLDLVEAPVVPWAQAVSTRFDLAVCSSLRGSLDRLMSPLLVGMHGAGIGKSTALLPGRRVPRPSAAGRREGVAATTVAVAHPEQSRFFADTDPDMDLVVVGDPCLDRLAASELQRGRYRNMLGLLPNQRFVLLSSTWGAGSLLDASPDIATRLAARLPNDGYRIALVLHPNIWIGHGGWQVRSWLGRARDAGVLVVAPWHNSWRSCLVASDVVVHDHGSLGLYAAALQRPTVTAGFASEQAMPGSAIAQLGELSPRLDLNRPLRHQIDDAVANYEPHRYLDAARRVSAAPGDSMRLHRDLIYRLMGLDPPDTDPRVLAVDAPAEPLPAVHSHRVATVVRASRTVTLDRFPASTPPPPPPARNSAVTSARHLVCDTAEPDAALSRSAAIIVDSTGSESPEELLARYAGCMYVVVRTAEAAAMLWHREGPRYLLQPDEPAIRDPAVMASAVYALETGGHGVAPGAHTVVVDSTPQRWSLEPQR